MGSDGNPTKNMTHAAAGRTRLKKATLEMPDTVVMMPGGEQLVLRRPKQESMPVFRKFNPKRINPASGKPHGKDAKPAFSQPGRVPFSKFILTAFVLHQLVGLGRSLWHRWQQRRARHLAETGKEEDWEEEQPLSADVVAADARLRQALLPAMMRAAMPKPQGRTKAHQQATAHRMRARHLPTASKMMRPGQDVRQKQPGMLGRLDKAMRQEVRQLVLAQEQAHQLQLEAAKRSLMLQGMTPSVPRLTSGQDPNQGTSAGTQALVQQQQQQRTPPVLQAASQPVKKR